ncbi:MAG TPA: DUF6134 family protein [Magnetospirillaceae bacterium]|jgi:hypothetical protein
MSAASFGRIGALAFAATIGFAAAAQAEELDFTIYKESDQVGHDHYTITHDGDITTVKVHTHTLVNVLFLKFHYDHDRTEVWKGNVLQSFVSDTNDDGTKHHVSVHRDGNQLVGDADGKSQIVAGDIPPFTLWVKSLAAHQNFFDIADFEQLKTEVADKGMEKLVIGPKTYDAHHYKITGDLNWDIWCDTDGLMLKSAFRRKGFPVFFVRE